MRGQHDLSSVVGKRVTEEDVDVSHEGARELAQAVIDGQVSSQVEGWLLCMLRYPFGLSQRLLDPDLGYPGGDYRAADAKFAFGTYFPFPARAAQLAWRALAAVVQEAHVHGVSSRKVDDMGRAPGPGWHPPLAISRICAELDWDVEAFSTQPIRGASLSVGGRAAGSPRWPPWSPPVSASKANGTSSGRCCPSEDEAFWTRFLRDPVRRGLKGVALVISDSQTGSLSNSLCEVGGS